jgi:AraC-like DNA-binding protein
VNAVIRRLLRFHREQPPSSHAVSPDLFTAIETRTDPREYHWDGATRVAGRGAHDVLFQYTLRGWGHYTEGGVARRVTPGHAFVAILPSAHVYCLPPESSEWTFFWLIVRHPYVSERLVRARRRADAIFPLGAQDALLRIAVKLFEGFALGAFRDDEFAREMAIFEFLIEYERFVHRAAGPIDRAEREQLLETCRRHVIANLSRAIDVSELAAIRQMSRSHFSHHFRNATGLSPGRFITDVRLQEVSRRLAGSGDTLKMISAQTGFADANHLCKVFRRHYHLSPGAFRKQMR